MAFDVEGAKKAGYSDAEIAAYLAKRPETQQDDTSSADYADVPGGGGAGGAQPQPGSVAASGRAWGAADQRSGALPTAPMGPAPGAVDRIGQAAAEGWRNAPTVVSPETEASIPPGSGLGLTRPAITIGNTALGAAGALFRGGQQFLSEAVEPIGAAVPEVRVPGYGRISGTVAGGPGLGRDVAAMPEAFPTGEAIHGTVGIRPAAPQSYADARAGAQRGTLQVGASAPPPVTLEELNAAIQRTDVQANRLAPKPVTPPQQDVQQPAGAQAQQPGGRPTTAAALGSDEAILANAKSVADQHYGVARAAGQDAAYNQQSVGKMVDAVDSAAPQGPGERAVAGSDNAVARLQRDMQDLRKEPSLTLADVQRMDERMSDLISAEYRADRKKVAGQLEDIQQKWREQADNATSADVTGGEAGFQALAPGRQAWTQYRKMSDVMLMKERADMTQNPTTSYKTAVKNFVTGNKSRGWTDEEKADLVASAERGVVGGTLHLLGSRLLPHVGGAVGASVGGIPGFIAGEAVTHGMGGASRNMANRMQAGRVNRVMGTLGGSVPAPPTNELLLR